MMIPPFALAFTWLVVPLASKRGQKGGKKLLHGKRKSSIVRRSSLQASGDDNDGGASGGGLEFLDCHHHFYDTMNKWATDQGQNSYTGRSYWQVAKTLTTLVQVGY